MRRYTGSADHTISLDDGSVWSWRPEHGDWLSGMLRWALLDKPGQIGYGKPAYYKVRVPFAYESPRLNNYLTDEERDAVAEIESKWPAHAK